MNNRSPITTHILDIATGLPASNVTVKLYQLGSAAQFVADAEAKAELLGQGVTNQDGRIENFLPVGHQIIPGIYRIQFFTGEYFTRQKSPGFFPVIEITFEISDSKRHHHVPLLLGPFGYSTYRGS